MTKSATAALSAAALACIAGTARAQTELYIAEYQFQAARMAAVNLDGTNPHELFPLPAADWLPLGLTYRPSTQRMIWMDSGGGSELHSAATNGSSPTVITGVSGFARGASLDPQGRIFFATDNFLQRVDADGSGLVTIFTGTSGNPLGMPRVDPANGHVYIGADGEIKRMDLGGSNLKTIVTGVSQPRAISLDIGRGRIYWIDGDTQSDFVGRANLDNTDFRVLIDISPSVVQSSGLIDLILDPVGQFVYYADELTGELRRAGLSGESPTLIYTTPAGKSPSGLVFNTGEPAQPLQDCNGNLINDDIDIAGGAPDCDNNGVIDTCQVNPCPARTFLLDQGSNAASTSGWAIGVPSQWQQFQPFDVPAGGWTVGEIGLDGYTVNWADGFGMVVRLYPDNGANLPNESQQLASTTLNLRFNTENVNWVYAPLSASLAPGRYWIQVAANAPTVYQGSLNSGFTGLQARPRGSSGVFGNAHAPLAVRLVQGGSCYPNCDASTVSPILNVADFTCFLSKYAAGDAYANCDGSTAAPVLNVADFTCFLQKYAAGCP
jgi:sugar lactone lactonase YvrE